MFSKWTTGCAGLLFIAGCASHPPMPTVDYVDLDRFMGDWYVIANIPTFIEKGAHNALESYERNSDGSIATTFEFRKDSYDGPLKTYHPTGFVQDNGSNAIWGMQFIWPIKADYRIIYLNADYTQTVIGRKQRDYVWIMARTPEISEADYQQLRRFIADQGYDVEAIREVPQRW
ncbi:Outer membrane lipoprotein [Methylophaga frappieri]|uniref:Outer membrane lipoprotein Blc n=1 Tax=Methylophaga frappieri (strain ATCC BAA-2434 / DSM 25690 / JAM7) TaxID=754477 RepID=I1YEN6_METFJ|nr:lipocalin family protein [Methylophaga frappieri]AFJ01379.1 Outer membrane lipoprotein [Methylophaga frappieri]